MASCFTFSQCKVFLNLHVVLLHAVVVLEARRKGKSCVTASHSGDWRGGGSGSGGGGEVCLSHECTQMFFHHHRLPATRKSGERGLMRWLVTGTSVMMSNSSVAQPDKLCWINSNSQTLILYFPLRISGLCLVLNCLVLKWRRWKTTLCVKIKNHISAFGSSYICKLWKSFLHVGTGTCTLPFTEHVKKKLWNNEMVT